MQFTSVLAIALAAVGVVQAQAATTTACSIVPVATPHKGRKCGVRGTLDLVLSSQAITANITTGNPQQCATICKGFQDDCVSFGYNYTTSYCTVYNQQLNVMGWKGGKKVNTDTAFYHQGCFIEECPQGLATTITSGGSTYTTFKPTPATTSGVFQTGQCNAVKDKCLSQFKASPTAASSVCQGIATQHFPPAGFGGNCDQQYFDAQITSVCSCLAIATGMPSMAANTTTSSTMPASTPANVTSTVTFSSGPAFTNSTTSNMASVTAAPVMTNSSSSTIDTTTVFANTSTVDITLTGAPATSTSSSSISSSSSSSSFMLFPNTTTTTSEAAPPPGFTVGPVSGNGTTSSASMSMNTTSTIDIIGPTITPIFPIPANTTITDATTTTTESTSSASSPSNGFPVITDSPIFGNTSTTATTTETTSSASSPSNGFPVITDSPIFGNTSTTATTTETTSSASSPSAGFPVVTDSPIFGNSSSSTTDMPSTFSTLTISSNSTTVTTSFIGTTDPTSVVGGTAASSGFMPVPTNGTTVVNGKRSYRFRFRN